MLRVTFVTPKAAIALMVAASNDGTGARNEARSQPRRSNVSNDGRSPAKGEPNGDVSKDEPAGDVAENELSDVRQLLHTLPELSEERMAEIKGRIKRGYYKRADVLERIAKRLIDQLSK